MVAPLVGAWIEIISFGSDIDKKLSLPLWERGLKSGVIAAPFHCIQSLPLWERGLKSLYKLEEEANISSLPLWERGLKSLYGSEADELSNRRSPCGSVD